MNWNRSESFGRRRHGGGRKIGPSQELGELLALYAVWVMIALRVPARAELWTVASTVTEILTPHPDISLGTLVFIQVEFDPLTSDLDIGDPTTGIYVPDDFTALIFGSTTTYLSTGLSALDFTLISVVNDSDNSGLGSFSDQLRALGYVNMPSLAPPPNEEVLARFSLAEENILPPIVLSSDNLPVPTTPLLQDFSTLRTLQILGATAAFNATVIGFGNAGGSVLVPVLPTSQITNPDGSITWIFSNGAELCVSGC